MKTLRIMTLGVVAVSAMSLMAQLPQRVEYFLDTDPDYGLGKVIGNIHEGDNQLTFDVSDVPDGAHVLSVRSQDDQGVWSTTMSRPLFIDRLQDIVYVEYFFDGNDPGVGKATSIALPDQDYKAHLDFSFTPDISALSVGEHELSVRAKDAFGVWTDVMSRKFKIVETSVPAPPAPVTGDLARLEYFFDTDPGYGKGHPLLNPTIGTNSYQMSFDGVEAGAHVLYIRAQEKSGIWSPTMSRPLYVRNSSNGNIVALEYFIDDADPGEGKAIVVTLPANTAKPFTFDAATDGLAIGKHMFNLRAKDDTGKWSVLKSVPFEVTDASSIVENNCIDGIYYKFYAESKTAEVIKGEKKYTGSIVIPKSVKYNGDAYTVTSIGDAAFSGCRDVTAVTIPESVTAIGWTAFEETGLTSVDIPNSVTSIGMYAFTSSPLTSVTIPNSVVSIGEGAFGGCHELTSIQVEIGNTVYDSRENCKAIIETASNKLVVGCKKSFIPKSVTAIGNAAFVYYHEMTSITIPNKVTSIGSEAFWGCGLTAVTIPENVTSIGAYAFAYCSELKDVYCYSKAIPQTEIEPFYTVEIGNATLHVPAEFIDSYKAAEPWKNFGKIVALEVSGLAGDANGDGAVNVFDVTAMVNYILGSPNDGFVFAAADVNGDGIVNVFDVTKVVNIILGVDNSEAKTRKAEGLSGTDKLYFEDFEIEPGEELEVEVLLDNPGAEYRDLQFDLYLPEGITVVQDEDKEFLVDTGSRCTKKHTIGFSYTDGHYVCMLYSTAKNPLTGNSGDILTITLKADDNVAPGVKTGFFRNVSLSKTDATGPTYDEFSFGFTVKGEVDAIEDVDAEAAPANKKILRNGEVIIIRDGKEYDTNGKPAQ